MDLFNHLKNGCFLWNFLPFILPAKKMVTHFLFLWRVTKKNVFPYGIFIHFYSDRIQKHKILWNLTIVNFILIAKKRAIPY